MRDSDIKAYGFSGIRRILTRQIPLVADEYHCEAISLAEANQTAPLGREKEAFAMKIKDGFVLRSVMGSYVVVAVGAASKSFRGMVKLNSTAADVWKCIETGFSKSEICDMLFAKYDVDRERVEGDVNNIIKDLVEQGFVEL